MDLTKIKDRIAKLLAKGNDTSCTVEEAEAFNTKAFALMQEYNLERAEIERKPEDARRTHRELKVQVRPWSTAIMAGLTSLYFCKWVILPVGKSHIVTIIGEESNVAMCHAIAVMVLRAVQTEARATGGGRSFLTGAGYRIHSRCTEMQTPAPAALLSAPDPSRNALMVLGDNEKKGNDAYAEELFGGPLKQARQSQAKVNDRRAFGNGVAFGNSVQLKSNLLR